MNGLGDRFKEGGDFGKELGGAAEFGDPIHDGATHDNSVCQGGDLSRLFGVGDSKADTNGKRGGFFEKGNFFSKGCGKALLHSSHAFTGNVVDEARSGGDEGTNTGFGCSRGDQNDAAQVASGGEVVGGFLGRKIEEKKSIRSSLNSGRFKLFPAEGEDRVVVGEEDEWHGALFFSQLGDESQNSWESGAGFEGALASELVDDAIGQGIGERDAKFDDVGSCLDQGRNELCGGGEIGITGYEIGDESFPLLLFEAGKEVVDPVGGAHLAKDCARDGPSFTRENRFRPRQSFAVNHRGGGDGDGQRRRTIRRLL